MSEYRVATRYAKSLLGLAIELKQEDQINQDMSLIADTCAQNRELVVVLKNPVVRYDKKLNILKAIFQGKVSKTVAEFITLIARKNRANLLPAIANAWQDQYNEYKNILNATVTSATSLTEQARKKILQEIKTSTGKTVVLDEVIDKDIIGGYILTIKDTQLDNSVSGRLSALKRKLLSKV